MNGKERIETGAYDVMRDISIEATRLMIGVTTLAAIGSLYVRPRGTQKGWLTARIKEAKAYDAMKGVEDQAKATEAERKAAEASRKRAALEDD